MQTVLASHINRRSGKTRRAVGICLLISAFLFVGASSASAESIRIVTWNVRDTLTAEDVEARRAQFQSAGQALDPDILLIQEITSLEIADKIREAMGLEDYFVVCSDFAQSDSPSRSSFEVAIISRFPFEQVIEFDPSPDNSEDEDEPPEAPLPAVAPTQQDQVAERLRRIQEQELDSLQRELDRIVADRGERHADVLPILFAIRDVYVERGAYVPATSVMARALAISEEVHGPESGETLAAVNILSVLYVLERDFDRALRSAERLRSTAERLVGPEHPAYGLALTRVGEALLRGGDAAGAAKRLETALSILKTTLGPAAHEATEPELLLAEAHLRRGRVRRTKHLLIYGLTIRSEAQDFRESEAAAGLYMAPFKSILGALYTAAGFHDEAEKVLNEALKAYEAALEGNHPDLEPVLVHLASLYQAKGDVRMAIWYRARAERGHADNLGLAFVEGAAPYAPFAEIPPASDPDGLFAAGAVGDWVEFSLNGEPNERMEIVRATPALVVVAVSAPEGDGWSVYKEEVVPRDIGLAEFHGADSLVATTCPFVTGEVECFARAYAGSDDSDPITIFLAPDVVPLGGLLRQDMGEFVKTLTRYRRGGDVVTVPELEGFPLMEVHSPGKNTPRSKGQRPPSTQ